MEKGWIKLHRRIIDWEWYQSEKVFKVFIHLLFTVNYERKKWQGIWIEAGQIVTSRTHLAEQLKGYGEQSIRTALKKLKSTNEITIKTTNKYTIITILKWKDYQQLTSKLTNNKPTTNQQLTTTKELKELKNNKPALAGVKKMKNYKEKTIDYDTREVVGEIPKQNKSKEAIRIAQMFDKMASEYTKKPIITPGSYFVVINAMKKHGLKPQGIEKLFDDWFMNRKIKDEDKVKLSFALSAGNINAFKVLN